MNRHLLLLLQAQSERSPRLSRLFDGKSILERRRTRSFNFLANAPKRVSRDPCHRTGSDGSDEKFRDSRRGGTRITFFRDLSCRFSATGQSLCSKPAAPSEPEAISTRVPWAIKTAAQEPLDVEDEVSPKARATPMCAKSSIHSVDMSQPQWRQTRHASMRDEASDDMSDRKAPQPCLQSTRSVAGDCVAIEFPANSMNKSIVVSDAALEP